MQITKQPSVRTSFLTLRFRLGAALCGVLAVGHLLCLPWLWQVFDLYGIATVMQQFAAWWQPLPYLITVGIALCFALAGPYGLAYCGYLRPLPLQQPAVWCICIVFLGRGLAGTIGLFRHFETIDLLSVLVATFIGLCYIPTFRKVGRCA